MVDLVTELDDDAYTLSARLFPNIEAHPGQVLVTPPKISADQETRWARCDAVRAGRAIERTNEHVRAGISRKTDMVIGTRLLVQPRPDWEILGIEDRDVRRKLIRQMRSAFNAWGYQTRNLCDAEGDSDFGGLMWLAFRQVTGPDAETDGVIHYDRARRVKYATPWATYIHVLDPDRIENPPHVMDSATCRQGVVRDPDGRWTGLWVRNAHPAESETLTASDYVLRERETWWGRATAWHWFVKTRAGQTRGMTTLVTIIKAATKLDALDDAHIGHAAIAAMMAVYIKTTASPETMAEQFAPAVQGKSVVEQKLDFYDKTKIKMGRTRIPLMAPNDAIEIAGLARSLADPTAFRNGFLRQFALALGISFEQLSNNYSDANFAAQRAAILDVWRGVVSIRGQFSNNVASPIYAAVIEEAVEIGMVEIPAGAPAFQENREAWCRCSWVGPGMGWVDPAKQIKGMEGRINAKVSTRENEAADAGVDWHELLDALEEEMAEFEARGLDWEINPMSGSNDGADGTSGDGTGDPKKKPGGVPGDGDGDGVPNEEDS